MDTKDSRVDTKSNTKPNEKCSGVLAELDKDTGGKGYHLIQVTLNNISAPPRNPPFKVKKTGKEFGLRTFVISVLLS